MVETPVVIVIEDEPLLARAVVRMLHGFRVEVHGTGGEALAALAAGGHAGAILCDMHLPDMTGIQVFAWIEAHRPDLAPCVLFMTGGSGGDTVESFLAEHADRVLHKPFRASVLLEKLRKVSPAS